MERFRIGEVVARTAQLWVRRLPLLFALVFVVSLPRIGYHVYRVLAPAGEGFELPDADSMWARWLPMWVTLAGTAAIRSVFIYLSQSVAMYAAHNDAGFRASLGGGLRRFVPVVRVALFLVFIEFAFGFATFYLAMTWDYALNMLVLYFVYGFVNLALAPFWVVVPVAVVERTRNDIGRSWRLTRGHRIKIFALLLLVYAASIGANFGLSPLTRDLPTAASSSIWWLKDLLFVAFEAVLAVVGYRALRLEKDGVDIVKLEGVFD